MNSQSVVGRSLELVDAPPLKTGDGRDMSQKPSFDGVEIIDSAELGRRLSVPATWIKSHTRRRTADEIPTLRLGRYVRFRWGSSELNGWIARHLRG
jgi:hypothetical protein